jgi:lupus La protein
MLQKGFGEELPGFQQKLERFFAKYGKVAAVRMRRVDGTKSFKVCNTRISTISANL